MTTRPLLTDEEINQWGGDFQWGMLHARSIYEADRAKLLDRILELESQQILQVHDHWEQIKLLGSNATERNNEILSLRSEVSKLLAEIERLEAMVPRWVDESEHDRLLDLGWHSGPDAIWYRPIGAIEAEWHYLMVPPIPLPEPKGGE